MNCPSLFNAIRDPAMILDRDNCILDVNEKTVEVTGVSANELVGKRCYEVFHGQLCPPAKCPHRSMLTSDTPQSYPMEAETCNMTFMVSVSPIVNDTGEEATVLHIAHDITKKAEQDALKLEVRLQQEELKKLESLKTMAGAIAHRFNNAMMAVQGNLEVMMLTLPVDSNEWKLASSALLAARGASEVGEMMYSYAGQRHPKLQRSSLVNLVEECVTARKEHLHSKISLEFNQPSGALHCFMDSSQIREVVGNVLSNAIESLEEGGGEIKITFGRDHFVASSFPLTFKDEHLKDGMYTFCQIQDTGHGITAEHMQRIFEPFYTTRFIGRGLGLALTVGIMRLHHGAITVESSPGKGATFRVLLPSLS